MDNLAPAISPPSGIGDSKPANQAVLDWVQEVARLTQPDNIFWCDGSERENDYLLDQACRQGVLIKLNEKKVPGSYLHRSNPNDVARVEQFTLICTPTKEEAGPTNHWADPAETYSKLNGMLKGAMKGRTMFVVPYIMGPPDSPLAKVGFEITDSIYVVLSMRIMTRMGTVAVKRLEASKDGEWNRGVHSLLDVNPDRRWICHFPQDNAIIFGRLRLRRQRFAEQEMSRAPDRFLSRAEAGLARGAHAHPRRRIAGREKALCGRGVSERLRQNEFRHAHSAETFCRLESDHDRRRHRVDADRPRRPALRGQSREWIFRRRAGHELQIESERDEVDRARHALYKRRAHR